MTDNLDLNKMLIAAHQAAQEGRWEDARQFYERIVDAQPNHPDAKNGLLELDRLEQIDAETKERVEEGDGYLSEGKYREAFETYTHALNHAGQQGLLKYHAALEQLRNQARELQSWEERVDKALADAEREGRAGDWDAARRMLDAELEHLPEGKGYEPLSHKLAQACQRAEQQVDAKVLIEQARAAIIEKDFEKAIRLLENIANDDRGARRMKEEAEKQLQRIRPRLDRAEAAYQEGDWASAFAELDKLRDELPGADIWQRYWLRVGMAHGNQELDAGRQANTQRNFQDAARHFEAAEKAFDKVLEVYDTHTTARALKDEAVDLARIAAKEAQAGAYWEEGQREEARTALEEAVRRIVRAREEGRDYAAVAAVVEVMLGTLEREIERIEQEERRLQDGARLLEARRLSEAAECFRSVLNALRPEHQERAREGLNQAEMEQSRFERDVKRGKASQNPADGVKAFQAAYERWPSGPGILDLLEKSLVAAGEAALEQGEPKDAIAYFDRALELNPDNRRAKAGKEKPGVQARVEVDLEWAAGELERLIQSPEESDAGFVALLDRLQGAWAEATAYEDLKERLDRLAQQAREAQKQWVQYDDARQQAEAARRRGDWDDGLDLLRKAHNLLPQARLTDRLATWGAAGDAVRRGRDELPRILSEAQAAYQEARESAQFSAIHEQLEKAPPLLDRIDEVTQAAGGQVPHDVIDLERRIKELGERVTWAQEAYGRPTAPEGLRHVQRGLERWPGDETLKVVAERLEAESREQVDSLLRQADTELESGQLVGALELMHQAAQLRPQDADINSRYAQLRRREHMETALRQVESDFQAKLGTNSPKDAVAALRAGLDRLQAPESDLSEEGRNIILELVHLSRQDDELAFANGEHWATVQARLMQLGQLGNQHWAARWAFQLVEKWATHSRYVALQGVVSSAEEMGNLLESYRAAVVYLRSRPQDEGAINQEADIREKLIAQSNESAQKRLDRAQAALARGDFEVALSNLRSIETEFYGPVEKEFPAVFKGQQTVDDITEAVLLLEQAAQRQQKLSEELLPLVEAAELAYSKNDLEGAEGHLSQISPARMRDAGELENRIGVVRANIREAREKAVKSKLRSDLVSTRSALRGATTERELSQLFERMKGLAQEIDLPELPKADRDEYYAVLDEIEDQRAALRADVELEAQADEAMIDEDYGLAVQALKGALDATKARERQTLLKKKLDDAEKQLRLQVERDEAEERGRALFLRGEYREAQQELANALRLGAAVDSLLKAARVGGLLEEARQAWDEGGDWEFTQVHLDEGLALAEGNPDAVLLVEEIKRFREGVKRRRQIQIQLQRDLNAARAAMKAGKLEEAQAVVDSILERHTSNVEALALREQIDRVQTARPKLERAREAYEDGRYEESQALVNTILENLLPGDPDAMALQRRIRVGLNARNKLQEAENYARGKSFDQARQALQEAVELGADRERVQQTQAMVERLQSDWEADRQRRERGEIEAREAREREEREIQLGLHAARRALQGNDLEAALKSVQEVLERRPSLQEAVTLQDQIQRASRARDKRKDAEAAMAAGNYQAALSQINMVLENLLRDCPDTPEYSEAMALRNQIEQGQEANELLVRAESLALSNKFEQARQVLEKALELKVDRERLYTTQQRVEELEGEWRAKTLHPIRETFLDGRYDESLRLCEQALMLDVPVDFRGVLENERTKITSRWVEKDLDALMKDLRQAAESTSDEGFSDLVRRLDNLAVLNPPAGLSSRIVDVRTQAYTYRLRKMIQNARRRADEGAWDEAIALVVAVKDQADAQGLLISAEALSLRYEFEDRQREERERAEVAERNHLVAAAQAARNDAVDRSGLAKAYDLLQQAQSIERFKDDSTINTLLDQIGMEIRLFDGTEEAVKNSKKLVRQRRFADAEGVLRLNSVSLHWQREYDHQRSLVKTLRMAEDEQDRESWEAALAHYQDVLEKDPTLQVLLAGDVDRCRQKLMERVAYEAQSALDATPPEPDQAAELLDRAEAKGWSTSAFSATVDRLRGDIAGLRKIKQADQMLNQGADPNTVLEILGQARGLLANSDREHSISQWEYLARAVLALEEGQLEQSRRLLAAVQPPVATVTCARRLEESLDKARINARELQEADTRIEEAMAAFPPRYEDIVSIFQHAFESSGEEVRFSQFKRKVHIRLQGLMESARQNYHYDEAINVARVLQRVMPGEVDDGLVSELERERLEQLEMALRQVEGLLDRYDVGPADIAIQRAETIAHPEAVQRLVDLKECSASVKQALQETDGLLKRVGAAVMNGEWDAGINYLRQAQGKTPGYAPVDKAESGFQNQVYKAASGCRADDRFGEALALCAKGLSLKHHDGLLGLHDQILALREPLVARALEALSVWDLRGARIDLTKGLNIVPDDLEMKGVAAQLEVMERQASEIRRAMEDGWAALRRRDYSAAQQQFDHALHIRQDFSEARRWRGYATTMDRAVDLALGNDLKSLPKALDLLKEAEQQLRIPHSYQSPAILDNLEEHRKQAIWDAHQLGDMLGALVSGDLARYEKLYEKGDLSRAFKELLPGIKHQQDEFQVRHRSPTAPPAGFSVLMQDATQVASEMRGFVEPVVDLEPPVPQEVPEPSLEEAEIQHREETIVPDVAGPFSFEPEGGQQEDVALDETRWEIAEPETVRQTDLAWEGDKQESVGREDTRQEGARQEDTEQADVRSVVRPPAFVPAEPAVPEPYDSGETSVPEEEQPSWDVEWDMDGFEVTDYDDEG